MKLLTFRTTNGTQLGRIDGDHVVALPYRDVGDLLRSGVGWLDAAGATGEVLSMDAVELAPCVVSPSKIVCLGLNYADHLQEVSKAGHESTSQFPILFAKFADALAGPYDKIMVPKASDRIDWEAEMVVVIGETIRNVHDDQAIAAIAGYAVGNDVSVRDWQFRTSQWLQGKTWEHMSPIGPMVTSDEVGGDGRPDLVISCELDGQVMQSARTSQLLVDCVQAVTYISTITTLRPGDLIFTGTCAGVGFSRTPPIFIHPGQTLKTKIEKLGECVNEFYAE